MFAITHAAESLEALRLTMPDHEAVRAITYQGVEFRPLRLCRTNNECLFHGYILVCKHLARSEAENGF